MSVSRRKFIQASSAVAVVGAAGCKPPEQLLSPNTFFAENHTPFKPPTSEGIDLISHHLNRLSFGPTPGEHERVRALGATEEEAVAAYIEEQLHPEQIEDPASRRIAGRTPALQLPAGEMFEYKERVLLKDMVRNTTLRATYSRRQLYEVMVQFWTDHFNIDPSKGDCQWLKAWDDREVIRKHALGSGVPPDSSPLSDAIGALGIGRGNGPIDSKFPEMVRASALSPAMLWYLDGRQNQRVHEEDKPNENYARELLELHTLGVHGGYTQQDVMEAARCLTGWTVRRGRGGPLRFSPGKVEFKNYRHDDGEKVVLGEKIPAGGGAADLDRLLEIVCLHPKTADYIALKLCRRFIADEPPQSAVKPVARKFLETGGDIRETLRTLFATDEFRNTRGNKFKRPFNFIVSALRTTGASTDATEPIYDYMRRMGHAPFNYPTPDGYPEEAGPWMGTLLWRWNFSRALSGNRIDRQTRVNAKSLADRAGGELPLMAHVLGRRPTEAEISAWHSSENGLALALASPSFQHC